MAVSIRPCSARLRSSPAASGNTQRARLANSRSPPLSSAATRCTSSNRARSRVRSDPSRAPSRRRNEVSACVRQCSFQTRTDGASCSRSATATCPTASQVRASTDRFGVVERNSSWSWRRPVMTDSPGAPNGSPKISHANCAKSCPRFVSSEALVPIAWIVPGFSSSLVLSLRIRKATSIACAPE